MSVKSTILKWSAAAIGVLGAALFSAHWLSTLPILSGLLSYYQFFGITFGASVVLAFAIYYVLRFRPTWYRALAWMFGLWIVGAGAVRSVGYYYILIGETPPSWVGAWFGPPSELTVIGTLACICVLAYLDFLAKHRQGQVHPTDRRSRESERRPAQTVADRPSRQLDDSQFRARYLDIFEQEIKQRIAGSIHAEAFLDLDISDDPLATRPPWVYVGNDDAQTFDSISEGMSAYNRRVLILGAPGSGKTTTLLHIAQQLIAEARADSSAPVPLFVNLSKFQLDRSEGLKLPFLGDKQPQQSTDADGRVEQWLADEFNEYPGISREIARVWLQGDNVAVLFDGLDEVDDHRRGELVKVLNETFLHDRPQTTTVVCSRIHEYTPLRERQETRLELDGAITLQPLSPAQVEGYLTATRAVGLRDALPKDAALEEMARTPLTLCMMTLAYGTSAPSESDAGLSLTERRHRLMSVYVDKMLQRKERRDRNLPFDENPDNDVKEAEYRYSPERVKGFLGWLAVRLSLRMRTSVSFDRFYRFLLQDLDRDKQSAVWWLTALSRGIFVRFGDCGRTDSRAANA